MCENQRGKTTIFNKMTLAQQLYNILINDINSTPCLHPWETFVQHPVPNLEGIQSVIPAGHEHIPLQIEAFITRVWCLTNHNLNPWSHMNLYFNNSLRNQSQESICINTSLSTDANLRSKYEIGTNVTSYDVHLELKSIRKKLRRIA